MAGNTGYGDCPFMPDVATVTPWLAGRDREVDVWRRHLAALKGVGQDGLPRDPKGNIVLMYGPRGMGKTALLLEFERLVAEEGGIGVVRRQAAAFKDGSDRLAAKLLAKVRVPEWRPASKSVEGKVDAKVVKGGATRTQVYDDLMDDGTLTDRLQAQCQKGPLVVLIDEAHTIKGEAGLEALQALVNAGQELGVDHPFLLVLAGTPGLLKTLDDADCSFLGRQVDDDLVLGIGRLDEKASREAIIEPLARNEWHPDGKRHLAVDAHALKVLQEDSEGYPYFLQQWGRELWRYSVQNGKGRLGLDDAVKVTGRVLELRKRFYKKQCKELAKGFMLEAACAVAEVFDRAGEDAPPSFHVAQAAITDALESKIANEEQRRDKACALLTELLHLGFCWERPGDEYLTAGIPSYMDHAVKTRKDIERSRGKGR